jgi:hypothetical protein
VIARAAALAVVAGLAAPAAAQAQPPPDTQPPGARLRLEKAEGERSFAKGLKFNLACTEPAEFTATMMVSQGTARDLGLRTSRDPLGTLRGTCSANRSVTATLKPTKAVKRKLLASRGIWRGTLDVALVDAAGNPGRARAVVRFRR